GQQDHRGRDRRRRRPGPRPVLVRGPRPRGARPRPGRGRLGHAHGRGGDELCLFAPGAPGASDGRSGRIPMAPAWCDAGGLRHDRADARTAGGRARRPCAPPDEDLRLGSGPGHRARRRQPRPRGRGVHRHHGPQRVGQVHADALLRRARHRHLGGGLHRGPGAD
ncbi:MAG: ABC-type antimicrobial peptide transport system, ATPase component, partial [uncultured Nocardioides sp.]